ncbi:hypothetical protein [Salinicoccus sp. CNSTN-B1]
MNNDAHHTLLFDYYNGHLEKKRNRRLKSILPGVRNARRNSLN